MRHADKISAFDAMDSNTQTQTAGGIEERMITLDLTREEIDALNLAAARLGMTAPALLSLALETETKNRAALIA